jgi:phage-related holin
MTIFVLVACRALLDSPRTMGGVCQSLLWILISLQVNDYASDSTIPKRIAYRKVTNGYSKLVAGILSMAPAYVMWRRCAARTSVTWESTRLGIGRHR